MYDRPSGSSAAEGARRNLVLCCDGTGNMWGNARDTNVVKLVRWCAKDARQVVYYDPGVGAADGLPAVSWLEELGLRLRTATGLARGRGIHENIAQAYEFLVRNHRAGDRVFLIGFSRGAFSVRAVSGLVNLFGIVRPSALAMLPILLRSYFSRDDGPDGARASFARDVRRNFTDPRGAAARIHFIGVWDTVESVGGLRAEHITSDAGIENKPFDHVRHAVSEGEYRAMYAPRLYAPPTVRNSHVRHVAGAPSLKQLWFAGAHSDVGGGCVRSGLSEAALAWMLEEAESCGLRRDLGALPAVIDPREAPHDEPLAMPLWAFTGLARRPAPPAEACHPSLRARLEDKSRGALPKRPAWRHPWLYAALGLMSFYGMLMHLSLQRAGAAGSALLELAWLQLSAPWSHAALRAQFARRLAWPLTYDAGFVAAYAMLLSLLVVYAVRALRDYQPESQQTHERLRKLFLYPLWVAPLSDLSENALTALVVHDDVTAGDARAALTWLLCGASLAKWLALATLLGGFGFALLVHGRARVQLGARALRVA